MTVKLDGTNGLLQQYDYQAPTTGFSYTFAAGVNVLVMNPAGTLATGTITMPASPADGMTITFSSTQTITALTVNANTGQSIVRKPTSFGAGSAMTFVYRLSNTTWYPMTNYATAGTVLQVVSATYSTTTSTTSSSYVTSNIQASITPSSASNKILIIASVPFNTIANTQACLTIFKNNTTDLSSSARGFGEQYSTVEIQAVAAINFLDSPATTSSTTYTVYFRAISSTTARTNPDSTQAVITLMEIAA